MFQDKYRSTIGKLRARVTCRHCKGSGESPEVVIRGCQVHLTMRPCRCLEGVIA